MRILNKFLKLFGVIVVPRYSAKMITETANIMEVGNRGNTVRWLRTVADQLAPGGDEYKKPPQDHQPRTIRSFHERAGRFW